MIRKLNEYRPILPSFLVDAEAQFNFGSMLEEILKYNKFPTSHSAVEDFMTKIGEFGMATLYIEYSKTSNSYILEYSRNIGFTIQEEERSKFRTPEDVLKTIDELQSVRRILKEIKEYC